jgi:cob(I)alamin adenosyltransferase
MTEMVYLSRIYTKTGDGGETGLGDGSRVPKDHPRVTAYGSVDELNSFIGVLLTQQAVPEADLLRSIQNDLFDVGADLCVPIAAEPGAGRERLRVKPEQTARLEMAIDRLNVLLSPLKSFLLPGGRPAAAWCQVVRAVCRRAERDAIALSHGEAVNPDVIIYLNRLSDLLFVLARASNRDGGDDVLWVPGKTAGSSDDS